MKSIKIFTIFFVLLFFGCKDNSNHNIVKEKPQKASSAKVYEYGELITIKGKLIAEEIETFQDYLGDSKPRIKTRIPVLKLEKGIDVAGGDEYNPNESGITEIQMAFNSWEEAKKYLDKNVVVTGDLYHQMTAHHYKKVLIFVEKIEEEKK